MMKTYLWELFRKTQNMYLHVRMVTYPMWNVHWVLLERSVHPPPNRWLCSEKVSSFYIFFAYLSYLKDSYHQTSQVTYVTMVPRVGNEPLRPLGVATGNASSVTRVWRYICKNTTCWPATAHDVTTGVSQYKCRREHTSSASSSEACVRSMAQSLGDAVSRSPLGEPWLHT